MSALRIDRPEIGFDEAKHAYTLDGEPVPGVSSIAKIGSDVWGPASAWGFRIGYEGAYAVLEQAAGAQGPMWPETPDGLRQLLKDRGLTPWSKRDRAGARGTAVHDALERLAQDEDVPDPARYPAEERGHVLSLVRWYLHFRPEFEAVEVMVGSREHRFAGRYDIRCRAKAFGLGMVDLKTSKDVYPETHFPQLEGYEGASVEMGFAPTDGRWVLCTNEDGSFDPDADFVRSWAMFDHFLAYLAAFRAIGEIKALAPPKPRRAKCKSCGAAITWVKTDAGKRMPLDFKPDPEGSVVRRADATCFVASVGVDVLGTRHRSHFETCANAAAHRRGR